SRGWGPAGRGALIEGRPSSPEGGGLDVRALAKRGRRPAQDDPPGLHHVRAGGDGHRPPPILLHPPHRPLPLAGDRLHDRPQLPHDQGRQPERWLVEHQQGRARHQRAADREHLLLAAAERAGELAPALAQAREPLEHLAERALDGLAVAPAVGAHLEVLEHGHLRKEPPPLPPAAAGRAGGARRGAPPPRRRPPRKKTTPPPLGRTSPESARKVDVLPAPLGPMIATISLSCTVTDTPSTAATLP